MNNSIKKKNNLITPEKAASFIPILISSGLSILLVIFFVIPQYIKSTKVNSELNTLIKKKNDLDNLKSKYIKTNQEFSKLNKEKEKIISLISGNSNLDTLLAQIGELGNKNNIEFESILPKEIKTFIETRDSRPIKKKSKSKNNKQSNLTKDPLLVEQTKKYLIEFNFKTYFVNLLSFLRELEFQENIILLEDINVKFDDKITENHNASPLKIKLIMVIYGKI